MSNIQVKLKGIKQLKHGQYHQKQQEVTINQQNYAFNQLNLDNPITGQIYGTALNYKGEYEALESEMNEDPYKAPPKAPILYIKPVNTFSSDGMPVPLPKGHDELQVGAALGLDLRHLAHVEQTMNEYG
ncbi:fumarylacetoacetate hydrolase family protein [Filobacillus milosensis]|uniref:fumarylacetoacetate hydrolase family protein n=1 Tax=Filobacillus milosensis TaxID=94137 RepID=UPI0018915FEB|nr:fumarylacetoacetate hydrolase family protein [Filobacillus milosensis]